MRSHLSNFGRSFGTHGDSEDSSHSEQVVDVVTHFHHFGNNGLLRPFDSKHFCQFPQVDRRSFPNREHWVSQPTHAEVRELIVEELYAELFRQERDIFDDRLSDSPLFVFSQFDDRR